MSVEVPVQGRQDVGRDPALMRVTQLDGSGSGRHESVPDADIEQKYVFPRGEELILEWLRHACRPDPSFAAGMVWSIYYDTPGFELYREKRNSDYLKSKVRLRWYSQSERPDGLETACFLEVKRKVGAVRRKTRLELRLSTDTLYGDPFGSELVSGLPLRLSELGCRLKSFLAPIIVIRYQRNRFVDPGTGARIALDHEICCPAANGDYVVGLPPVHLRVGVLEVKGAGRQLPPALAPIGPQLVRESFSKYARCLEELTQPKGRRE